MEMKVLDLTSSKSFYNSFDVKYHENEDAFFKNVLDTKTFFILDYGKREFYLWRSDEDYHAEESNFADKFTDAKRFPLNTWEDFDRLIELVGDNILLTEHAHWKPRTKKSKSQPLTGEQLLYINKSIRDNGGWVMVCSQDMTSTYLDYFRLKSINKEGRLTADDKKEEKTNPEKIWNKMDTKDPFYLYHAIVSYPKIMSAFSFSATEICEDCEISEEEKSIGVTKATKAFGDNKECQQGKKWRKKTNANLNYSRMNSYSVANPEEDSNTLWMLDNFDKIKTRLDEETKFVLGFEHSPTYHKEKKKTEQAPICYVNAGKENQRSEWTSFFSNVSVLSVIGSIRNPLTGNWMLNDNSSFPNNNFMKKYIFGFRPKRKGSGVIRSNLAFWSRTTIISDYCKNAGTPTKNGASKFVTYSLSEETRNNFLDIRKAYKRSIMNLYKVIKEIAQEEISNGSSVEYPLETE